jgi:hypothetical protein
MMPCKPLIQGRVACIRSVCCGAGLTRQGKFYVGLASNDLLEISEVVGGAARVGGESRVLCHGHTRSLNSKIESQEWVFTIPHSRKEAQECLNLLNDAAHINFLIYRHKKTIVDADERAAHSLTHSTSASRTTVAASDSNSSTGEVSTWHAKPSKEEADLQAARTRTRIHGMVQFKTPVTKAHVALLIPAASIELAGSNKSDGSAERGGSSAGGAAEAAHIGSACHAASGELVKIGILSYAHVC